MSDARRLPRTMMGLGLLVVVCLAGCASEGTPPASGPYFPTREQEDSVMDALFRGPLVVQDDCVLAGEPGGYALPVWPSGSTADVDASGRIVVRDPEGAVVAVEGETFEMGGGFTAEFQPTDRVEAMQTQVARVETWLGYAIPDRCLTPDVYGVWVVGDTTPLQD